MKKERVRRRYDGRKEGGREGGREEVCLLEELLVDEGWDISDGYLNSAEMRPPLFAPRHTVSDRGDLESTKCV